MSRVTRGDNNEIIITTSSGRPGPSHRSDLDVPHAEGSGARSPRGGSTGARSPHAERSPDGRPRGRRGMKRLIVCCDGM